MSKLSPIITIVLSFMIVIVIGTLLLKLPISSVEEHRLSWVDSLFISTSAICVTGLSPVADLGATLTLFGKIVLVLLIQIGGLGFITIAVYVLVLAGVKIGIEDRQLVKEALNQESVRGLMKLVKRIIVIVFAVEFSGFVILFFYFLTHFEFWDALGNAAFHAISAFNNCGFDLLGDSSFLVYKDSVVLNITIMLLVMSGGIGFIVIDDIIKKGFRFRKYNTHTVLVLKTSLVLWISGMLLLKITEGDNITWLQAAFQSVCARTAGFATMDMTKLSNGGVLVIIVLMFFGAAPCSTGGGVKVTAVYAIFKAIVSYAKGGTRPMVRGRMISPRTVYKAFVLVALAVGVIVFSVFLMSLIEPEVTMDRLMLEVTSAFGTVGFSMGLTPNLHPLGKLVLVPVMFVGRLGPLTMIALLNRRKYSASKIGYVEENLIIG